ncbi:MAG: hypothetical protein QOH76_872 [Thermoleophilaceae bacterium]|nr:hypothetical protein [Thermoleophilaceae bacterium]
MREAAGEIEAVALVPAAPEEVFAFLSDLANHWRLVDRFVEVLSLEGTPPDRAVVRLRGPLGVRRTVITRVTATRSPRLIIGVAELGEETRARVSWTLAGRLGQTRVRLAAEVEHAGPLDRLLLTLGGRTWLRRRFAFGLERLAERFSGDDAEGARPAVARSARL